MMEGIGEEEYSVIFQINLSLLVGLSPWIVTFASGVSFIPSIPVPFPVCRFPSLCFEDLTPVNHSYIFVFCLFVSPEMGESLEEARVGSNFLLQLG